MITKDQMYSSDLNRRIYGYKNMERDADLSVKRRVQYILDTFVREVNQKIPGTYCISCYRTKRLNRALNSYNIENGREGSSQYSKHLVAGALDLKNNDYDPIQLARMIKELITDHGRVVFIKIYDSFIHVEPFIPNEYRVPNFLSFSPERTVFTRYSVKDFDDRRNEIIPKEMRNDERENKISKSNTDAPRSGRLESNSKRVVGRNTIYIIK